MFNFLCTLHVYFMEGGDITLVPKVFMIMFSYLLALQLWRLLLNFDWFGHKIKCPNVLTNKWYLQNGFCLSVISNQPLSYPLRSHIVCLKLAKNNDYKIANFFDIDIYDPL